MAENLLQQLLAATDPAEKAALVAHSVLANSDPVLAKLVPVLAFLRWFDEPVLAALLPETERPRSAELFARLTALPFVERVSYGFALHELTRQGLLAEATPQQRLAAADAGDAYKQEDDSKHLLETLYCLVLGEQSEADQILLTQRLYILSGSEDAGVSSAISQAIEEANSLVKRTVIVNSAYAAYMTPGEPPLGMPNQVRAQIDLICILNLESGRAAKVMHRFIQDTDDETTVAEISAEHISRYRNLVTTVYLRESEYVERLYQQDRDAWERLWAHLHRTCHHMLSRRGLAASEAVEDFVQQTCETIFLSRFPYDVSFDAWVNTILNNHILQRYTHSREFLDRIPFVLSLDVVNDKSAENGSPGLDEMIQELGSDAFAQFDDRMLIFDAIERLGSQHRQDVILYTYFWGWSDEDIAQKLNKSRGAIHTLRHRALKELRELTMQRPS